MSIKVMIQNLKDEMVASSAKIDVAVSNWQDCMEDLKEANKKNKLECSSRLSKANDELWALYNEIKPALEFIVENHNFAQQAIKGAMDFQKAKAKKKVKE